MNANDIIMALGNRSEIASHLFVSRNTVDYWIKRNRIPLHQWEPIVDLAHRRRVPGISIKSLSALWNHTAKRKSAK